LTLLELLVALSIGAVIVGGAVGGYVAATDFQIRAEQDRLARLDRVEFEAELTRILQDAYISTDANDPASLFLGDFGQGSPVGQGGLANTLTFTALQRRIPTLAVNDQNDFETQNRLLRTQGGLAELSLSLTAVGQTERTGLFLRTQRPADGDPTQGGDEEVLDPSVQEIGFEFWDGQTWQGAWDTRSENGRRLPSAIRVSYRREEDEELQVLIVRVPASDATPEDPVGVAG
jgi:type II secretory pathway component PulJ